MHAHHLSTLSLYALKHLRKELSLIIKERERPWRKDRHRKYGNMNKGFTQEELTSFLASVTTEKYRVLFTLMALAGLRVHEAVAFEWSRIDWRRKILQVYSQKTRRSDEVPMSEELERVLTWWYGRKTESAYLFPGEIRDHVSVALASKRFREAADRAGLCVAYCTDARGNRRHRLSTHSLRHYFVTMVQRHTHDPELTRRLARHTNASTTMLYMHPSEDETRCAVNFLR